MPHPAKKRPAIMKPDEWKGSAISGSTRRWRLTDALRAGLKGSAEHEHESTNDDACTSAKPIGEVSSAGATKERPCMRRERLARRLPCRTTWPRRGHSLAPKNPAYQVVEVRQPILLDYHSRLRDTRRQPWTSRGPRPALDRLTARSHRAPEVGRGQNSSNDSQIVAEADRT